MLHVRLWTGASVFHTGHVTFLLLANYWKSVALILCLDGCTVYTPSLGRCVKRNYL